MNKFTLVGLTVVLALMFASCSKKVAFEGRLVIAPGQTLELTEISERKDVVESGPVVFVLEGRTLTLEVGASQKYAFNLSQPLPGFDKEFKILALQAGKEYWLEGGRKSELKSDSKVEIEQDCTYTTVLIPQMICDGQNNCTTYFITQTTNGKQHALVRRKKYLGSLRLSIRPALHSEVAATVETNWRYHEDEHIRFTDECAL